jgi:hypothetical protein
MREHQLPVVCELVDLVEVIVDDPDLFFVVVRTHLDLVRSPAAPDVEELVMLGPVLNQLSFGIHGDHDVQIPALISATSVVVCRWGVSA